MESDFKEYFTQQAYLNHQFKTSSTTCENCGYSFHDCKQFTQMYSTLYPSFVGSIDFFSNRAPASLPEATSKSQLMNISFANPNLIVTKTPLNSDTFSECHVRLYDCPDNVEVAIRIGLYLETYDSTEYVELDLTENTYRRVLATFADEFECVQSRLVEKKLLEVDGQIKPRNRCFYSNDLIVITYSLAVSIGVLFFATQK
jgi:hypothetical protein